MSCYLLQIDGEVQAALEMKDVGTQFNWKIIRSTSSDSQSSSHSSSQKKEQSGSSFVQSSSSTEVSDDEQKEKRKVTVLDNIKKFPRFFLGLSKTMSYIVNMLSEEVKCDPVNVLITLQRIRQADTFFRLGLDFNFSTGHISKIFKNTLPKIAYLLRQLIIWPSEQKIKRNLPIQFRYKYKNVQSIIDCYEVEIEKPTNPNLQAMTWSSYKNCNTIKYLISATPDGLINFISEGYGGRTSDIAITKDCKYLEILPTNCVVMADRGFKELAPLLAAKNCKLIRPPSVSAQEKLSKESIRESKKIASCRVHIERVIRRVREFNYVQPHSRINIKNVYMLDQIMYTICGLVNLQKSLLKH